VIIYRQGNLTPDNFTPRPGKDTVGGPGQAPGLSASVAPSPGRKAQGIEIGRIKPPLRATPDDPERGGTPGHFAIAPVDMNNNIDIRRLEAWAQSRGSGQTHELTQILLDAVVQPNAKGRTQ